MADETEAPGWNAIDEALHPLYGDTQPKHYASVLPMSLGGKEPLSGLSAYKNDSPRPHWHIITYGLSELHEKESEDPNTSGFGFELTLRVARARDEEEPPPWALNFLQNLARYVFQTGNRFGSGHHMNLNGPIALGHDTRIEAVFFAPDPQLPFLMSPNGALQFLQVVGVTLDELDAAIDWNVDKLCEVMEPAMPLLITDLSRRSVLERPEIAERVRQGTEREGSSMDRVLSNQVRWKKQGEELELTVGALIVERIVRMLRGRTEHGQPFALLGQDAAVSLVPAPEVGWEEKDYLEVRVSPAAAREMRSALVPKRGRYVFTHLPRFALVVEPTEIKDEEGKVLRVVG